MPQTTAERQAAFKARLKEAGLVRVEVFVPPERKEEIKRIAAELATPSIRNEGRQRKSDPTT